MRKKSERKPVLFWVIPHSVTTNHYSVIGAEELR